MYNLKEEIRKVCKTGSFTLTSGQQSDFYVDVKSLLLNPNTLFAISRYINRIIHDLNTTLDEPIYAIGGMELGSVPLSTAACLSSLDQRYLLHQFIIRKKLRVHGTLSQVEGWTSIKDKNIVLVDDVTTTGDSFRKMIQQIGEHANIIALLTVVDREETYPARDDGRLVIGGFQVVPLYKKSELI